MYHLYVKHIIDCICNPLTVNSVGIIRKPITGVLFIWSWSNFATPGTSLGAGCSRLEIPSACMVAWRLIPRRAFEKKKMPSVKMVDLARFQRDVKRKHRHTMIIPWYTWVIIHDIPGLMIFVCQASTTWGRGGRESVENFSEGGSLSKSIQSSKLWLRCGKATRNAMDLYWSSERIRTGGFFFNMFNHVHIVTLYNQ